MKEGPLIGHNTPGSQLPSSDFSTPASGEWSAVVKRGRDVSFKGIVKDAISETNEESQIREESAKNFVIFRADASEKRDRKSQTEKDKVFVRQMCQEIEADDIEVVEVTRLGPKTEGKTRPLRVTKRQ